MLLIEATFHGKPQGVRYPSALRFSAIVLYRFPSSLSARINRRIGLLRGSVCASCLRRDALHPLHHLAGAQRSDSRFSDAQTVPALQGVPRCVRCPISLSAPATCLVDISSARNFCRKGGAAIVQPILTRLEFRLILSGAAPVSIGHVTQRKGLHTRLGQRL